MWPKRYYGIFWFLCGRSVNINSLRDGSANAHKNLCLGFSGLFGLLHEVDGDDKYTILLNFDFFSITSMDSSNDINSLLRLGNISG